MTEDGQTQSIQARIAAINLAGNLGHVGRAPITAYAPDQYASQRPSLEQRSHTVSGPSPIQKRATSNGIGNEPNVPRKQGVLPPPTNITRTGQAIQQAPRLPPRKQSSQPSPALPLRRTSDHLSRKASNESIVSTVSTISSISGHSNSTVRSNGSRTPSGDTGRIKAPAYDPASLPPLPPKRTRADIEARYKDIEKAKAFPGYKDAARARISVDSAKSAPSVSQVEVQPAPAMPILPPRRPSRLEAVSTTRKVSPERPPPMPARSALSFGLNKPEEPSTTTNGVNDRSTSPSPPNPKVPPPVPLASRPDLSKIKSSKPTIPAIRPPCLVCRDFSAPDTHAAKFSRASVPSLDWLATQLTAPFPSATDQARAIFTWLHHNISYDTVAFFNNVVRPSTPASTLSTGLAVCEGYAGLFTALATKAGLQSVVVGGHGKGYGFSALQPGQPIPPESQGHAWNSVRIDNGYWKLIDCCWGAGNVNGKGQPYNRHFSPRMFTMSNEEFGLRHFPADRSQFFRDDGRQISWEEYVVGDSGGELLTVYSGVAENEGISETSFLPKYKKLPLSPPPGEEHIIRFQFSRLCPHWDPIRNGAGEPYVFILAIQGVDGREKDYLPFETNGDTWWCDVDRRRLGRKGQTISAFTVESVGGESGRGLGIQGYLGKKGRVGMGFGGLAAWDLV